MKTKVVNEDSAFAYPEIFEGANDWAYADEDSPITVSSKGLRDLLNLVGDCWPTVMGLSLKSRRPDDPKAVGPYADAVTSEAVANLANRLSKVWCEGDLIVSGLFIDPADGTVLLNKSDE